MLLVVAADTNAFCRQYCIAHIRTGVQAIALDANAALPHIAACTSMGRLALLSDNKTKVRLAHDARQEAVIALAVEPSNDLAHHLMGRWHSEMANLNMVARTVVRVVYGTSLAPGESSSSHECCDQMIGFVQWTGYWGGQNMQSFQQSMALPHLQVVLVCLLFVNSW